MSEILIIHHSLDAKSARLLARALTRLGFKAPAFCDEMADASLADALSTARKAVAIWSGASSGSAPFIGVAAIADATGKLLSLRGPDGQPPAQFGRACMLAGLDGQDLTHPGIVELARLLAGGKPRPAAQGRAPLGPIAGFPSERWMHPGPASGRLRPPPAPAQDVRSAANAALDQLDRDGEAIVLAPARLAPVAARTSDYEIDSSRVIRRAPAPSPEARVAPRKKRRASILSFVAGDAAFGVLCCAVAALIVGAMAPATHTSFATPVETQAAVVASAAEIVVAQPAAFAAEAFVAAELIRAPARLTPLAPVNLALDAQEPAPVATLSWRVVAPQIVE